MRRWDNAVAMALIKIETSTRVVSFRFDFLFYVGIVVRLLGYARYVLVRVGLVLACRVLDELVVGVFDIRVTGR